MIAARSSSRIVVDASVAAKWYLLDEEHAEVAGRIFDRFTEADVDLIVPSLFHVEVISAVWNATRGKRAAINVAREVVTNLQSLGIPTVPLESLLQTGLEHAQRYNCAVYDALYLALADQADCPFIHADRRLHNTLAGRFPREVWIEDYSAR